MAASSISQIDLNIQDWPANDGTNPGPITLNSSNSTFSAFPADYLSVPITSVQISADNNANPSVYVDVSFVGPEQSPYNPIPLVPGTYTNIERWPFVDPNYPGFDLDFDYWGEDTYSGTYTILEAEWNPDGTLSHFGATFDVVGGYPEGTISFNGDVYYDYDLAITPAPEPGTTVPLSLLLAFLVICKLRPKSATRAG
jgi:hypothetical protein